MTCDGLVVVECHFAPESHLKNILIIADKKTMTIYSNTRQSQFSYSYIVVHMFIAVYFEIKLDHLTFYDKILM